ncbi:MAG: primosomal protein N' [Ignavibacteriales bacterium]|nr:primosomal protein N' [Ignavibacteriales bacterium]
MTQKLVDIALPVPLDRTFTYMIPPELAPSVQLGRRVLVPFGRKKLSGIVVGFPEKSPLQTIKPLIDVLDASPTFSEEMLKLTRWISEYYLASWGDVLKAASPQGTASGSTQSVRLAMGNVAELIEKTKRSARVQHAILRALAESGTLSPSQLQKRTRTKNIQGVLQEMQSRGWILVEQRLRSTAKPKMESVALLSEDGHAFLQEAARGDPPRFKVTAKQLGILAELKQHPEAVSLPGLVRMTRGSLSTVKTLEKRGLVRVEQREVLRGTYDEPPEVPPQLTLNGHQEQALRTIVTALGIDAHRTFLLYGITGSGKTQVYIEAMRETLRHGKNAIVLVPEISLTPQTVRRFKSHFGADVAVMHSQMSVGERYDAWRLAHEGRIRVVIGPRSAIFAPLKNIGLIVVDEEHEASYKQYDSMPRYHARDVAIVRASINKAVVVLGSATPSAESYHNAISEKYELLSLPERVDNAQLPTIEIVDMAKERQRRYEEFKKERKEKGTWTTKLGPAPSISLLLKGQIDERLKKGEGTILLQNRRGFSHVVECFECGFVERCDHCDVTLTFHATKKHLRCHYCGFVKAPPAVCPKCHGTEIRHHAFGTQQIHEELGTLFPDARVLRMDLDTTGRKGAHDRLLTQFGNGEADILLGTQMVAKGLDFPRVTLVGVISADTQMLLPDFRSSERTFQLLTQVAGRAGRSKLSGEVIIQTLQPSHYSLRYAAVHDFAGFLREELAYRKELDYPPFSRLVLIEFKGEQEGEVAQQVKKIAGLLQGKAGAHYTVLGPADAAIPKIKNQYRKHIVIKNFKSTDPSGSYLRAVLLHAREFHNTSPLGKNRKVHMTIDVDPQGMM